jgi:cytochrome c-type biogenesis protein CcmH
MIQKLKRPRWWVAALVLLISLIPISAFAQGSDPTDDDVNEVARQLYCPVCENIPLDTCGTTACEQWRGIIRDKLADGWTEDEIKNYFVNQYGDRVLAEPPRRGFNWVVYLVPVAIFVGGGFLFYRGFQQWSSPDQNRKDRDMKKVSSKPVKLSEDDISRVEEELRKRSQG